MICGLFVFLYRKGPISIFGFFEHRKGCGHMNILNCSPVDTDSKYIIGSWF